MDSSDSLVTPRTACEANVFMARIKYIDLEFRMYVCVIQFILQIVLQRKLVMLK